MPIELSVIVPSYGLDALLHVCIAHAKDSISAAGVTRFRLVVVDNGSPRPYQRRDLDNDCVDVVRLDRRVSFSKACNVGARQYDSRLLFFLNNDVLLDRNAVEEMLHLMTRQNVAICGARLVYPSARIQHCGVRFDRSEGGCYHEYLDWPTTSVSREVRDFQAVTGAALMIDGKAFANLDGFDESYPFGYEDIDLCLRARQTGATVTCAQAVDSIHFESTTNRDPSRMDASRQVFLHRWSGRFSIDGAAPE